MGRLVLVGASKALKLLKLGIQVIVEPKKLLLGYLHKLHKSQIKTSLQAMQLLLTHEHLKQKKVMNKGRRHDSLKMTSTSHKEFKYFSAPSLLAFYTCILTTKRQYFEYTCLTRDSMEI